MLRSQLQTTFIKLVDAQHNIDYVTLYHQFSHNDISEVTQHVKNLYTPLHGIGLSVICKYKEQYTREYNEAKDRVSCMELDSDQTSRELIKVCTEVLDEICRWISNYKEPSHSLWSTFFWPFPRIDRQKHLLPLSVFYSNNLEVAISRQIEATKCRGFDETDAHILKDGQQQQLLHLFQFNLVGYAKGLYSLACVFEQLNNLEKKKIWLPQISFKHWLRPSSSDSATIIGGQVTTSRSLSESSTKGDKDNFSFDKTSTLDLESAENQEQYENGGNPYICTTNRNNKPCPRDPDFDIPSSRLEHCFGYISNALDWIYSMETIFAFKTATGFILLSLPAYLPQSVGWFTGWGGQWVANALIMWIFPMAGMFNFT